MSKPDRSIARARKALAHATLAAHEARDAHKAARTLKRADRHARHAKRALVEAYRLADLAEA